MEFYGLSDSVRQICISLLILIQSFLFVIPSIICGYAGSIPALMYIYKFLFKNQSDIKLVSYLLQVLLFKR